MRLLKLVLKAFWELSPWLINLLPSTTSELNQRLEGNTSQVLRLIFCSFLTGILASQVFNFCLSIFKRLPKLFWYCCLFISSSAEALCLDPQPLSLPSFGKSPKGKGGNRILAHLSVVLSSPGLFCPLNSWLSQKL